MEVITYPETYISRFIHTYKKLLAELRESYKDNKRLENKNKSYVGKKKEPNLRTWDRKREE